jgi:hypothetical protein
MTFKFEFQMDKLAMIERGTNSDFIGL